MLKYIKRQARRRRSSHDDDVGSAADVAAADAVDCAAASQKRHSLRSTTSFCDEIFLEQLTAAEEAAGAATEVGGAATSDAISCGGGSLNSGLLNATADEDIFKYNSRLSMTLAAIVSEPNCLSYFVQYLDTRNALALIKFYLDIENFKRAAELEDNEKKKPEKPAEDNDVPELKTLCDLSMRKPLTDDEKSRIYAETSKQMSNDRQHCDQAIISAASISDAIAIYQKYLIVNARLFVELPIGILAHISLLLCGKSNAGEAAANRRDIPASCFDEARDFVLQQLERDYMPGFLQSSYYSKFCVELIEGGDCNVYDVLYSELALFYFTEYLEQQNERDCLEFWITAINFRRSFKASSAEAQADAMIIYERYFSLQCECRLWMSDKLRLRVEQTICAPGQLAYAFDLALLVTAKYLEQKHFADFLKSHIFDNYVNELKAKQRNEATPAEPEAESTDKLKLRRAPLLSQQQRHRKTLSMSDCQHISQHNTLLAAMDNNTKPNLNIDARQLANPQLLWQRPSRALKFGRVNSLGRYERDFEAVGQTSWSLSASGNKLKNAVRKLVNLPEDNVQEEIAWQVAEMIVNDVTSVTLNGKQLAKS